MLKQEDIVARSVSIEVIGEIHRCNEGEYSKFYCLPDNLNGYAPCYYILLLEHW